MSNLRLKEPTLTAPISPLSASAVTLARKPEVNSRMLATSGRNNYEVSTTTKSLSMDLSRNIIDSFNKSLIPFRNCTSESQEQPKFMHPIQDQFDDLQTIPGERDQ